MDRNKDLGNNLKVNIETKNIPVRVDETISVNKITKSIDLYNDSKLEGVSIFQRVSISKKYKTSADKEIETSALRHLNEKNNNNVPKLIKEGEDTSEVSFVDGVTYEEIDFQGNPDTYAFLVRSHLIALGSIVKDGVVHADPHKANFIEHVNLNGVPTDTVVIDFGRVGDVINNSLVISNTFAGDLPEKNEPTIDPNKAQVYFFGSFLSINLISNIGRRNIPDGGESDVISKLIDLSSRMTHNDPTIRVSLDEAISELDSIIDFKRVGSILNEQALQKLRTAKSVNMEPILIKEEMMGGVVEKIRNELN